MYKTLALLGTSALLMLAVAPSGSALVIFQESEDRCNGIYETDGCTCDYNDRFCQKGEECELYVDNTCIRGGDALDFIQA